MYSSYGMQVYLGPEITIEVTGQRALAILSRGSLVLNTSIAAEPSTLGGFPGGGGISRDPGNGEMLLSPPSVPPSFTLSSLANGTLEEADIPSYNINGPGSASYRYYLFTITTLADDVNEAQRVSMGRGRRTGEGSRVIYASSLGVFCERSNSLPGLVLLHNEPLLSNSYSCVLLLQAAPTGSVVEEADGKMFAGSSTVVLWESNSPWFRFLTRTFTPRQLFHLYTTFCRQEV